MFYLERDSLSRHETETVTIKAQGMNGGDRLQQADRKWKKYKKVKVKNLKKLMQVSKFGSTHVE